VSRFLTAHQHNYSVGTCWKIWDKSRTDTTKTKDNQEKANITKRSKTKLAQGLVVSWLGNELGLFNNAPGPIRHRIPTWLDITNDNKQGKGKFLKRSDQ